MDENLATAQGHIVSVNETLTVKDGVIHVLITVKYGIISSCMRNLTWKTKPGSILPADIMIMFDNNKFRQCGLKKMLPKNFIRWYRQRRMSPAERALMRSLSRKAGRSLEDCAITILDLRNYDGESATEFYGHGKKGVIRIAHSNWASNEREGKRSPIDR
ncbi:hypothetical protein PHYBLDRAFT_147605 [Phycomyces blakesleeanus NRRL 1555(-)]|uniref:Uncharacterized protein n=1 Tax=Phycomyces blakesleeanus (strain ATCC 8743b / DSM 1359 / FGSC 10004 / NBRC 33097 / NRRL 1555) TaxID=763407 RepID=A0A162WVH4_PHYB8|nr:hypothetical protein PHYBLDRAFT_147605 [Phycomyces blakesleeanus NRRL 1555(-)]OAD71095.1 hypothetical protein PHYBLDRAFT_147605 [Phycomyces blakesleeanus NRRL 1555(-)]|eukprot:XP_018289135.1 hypothetical protein PHYBLDRAFT_147605 [Phycomyces blakesleeanus NRRL 1555(-)]